MHECDAVPRLEVGPVRVMRARRQIVPGMHDRDPITERSGQVRARGAQRAANAL